MVSDKSINDSKRLSCCLQVALDEKRAAEERMKNESKKDRRNKSKKKKEKRKKKKREERSEKKEDGIWNPKKQIEQVQSDPRKI